VLSERRLELIRTLGAVSATRSGTTADTCQAMLDVLAGTRQSVPFGVAILRGDDDQPRVVGAYGLTDDAWSKGMTLARYAPEATVVGRVIATGKSEVLTDLRERYPAAIERGPIGPLIPDEAMVLPLTVARGITTIGALVLGVNPYRCLDDEYREFLSLIGLQVGVALTDSQAYEAERNRVRVMADLDRGKMEFFQNVSHELRTPLTLLLAPLQDLLDPPDSLQPDQRVQLQAAVRAAQRLRRMVNALLDFAQAEAGTLSPHLQSTDLTRLTAETASMFRSTAEHACPRFDLDLPPTPTYFLVDAAMWSTILTNLLANAVKYTAEGGVSVALRVGDDGAVLSVGDTGKGISAAEQARVFERFYRSHEGGSIAGAGIGLALVTDLVRAHNGTIELTSTPGAGSSFRISIPRVAASEADAALLPAAPSDDRAADGLVAPFDTPARPGTPHAAPEASSAAASAAVPQPPRVLLVEDDSDLRDYLTRLLTGDGWDVQAFGDAESAGAAIATENADKSTDLVLTDVMLPGRSGLELVAELRAGKHTSRIPIIVLTARGGADAAAQGLASGADDYITKPFASQELLARVRANHELHSQRERAIDDAQNRANQVRAALDSNRLIGTAIGVLMASHRLTAAQGFQLLTRASQDSNRKLRDLAAMVVDSGKLPFRPTTTESLVIRVTSARP